MDNLITIGNKAYEADELAREIEVQILTLDAEIKALKRWRETRVEILEWLTNQDRS